MRRSRRDDDGNTGDRRHGNQASYVRGNEPSGEHEQAAGQQLLALRKRIEAGDCGDVGWWQWYAANVDRSRKDAEKLMRMAAGGGGGAICDPNIFRPTIHYRISGKQREDAMGMMIVRHKVRDYGQWRPIFDRHAEMQRAAGLVNPRVYHSADSNKSEIVVVFDTEDTKKAKEFAASPDLIEAMMAAGVLDTPTIYFLESID